MRRPIHIAAMALWALGLLGTWFPRAARAQLVPLAEYEAKALMLYKVLPFVDWPADTPAGSTNALVIGVLGDDQVAVILEQFVRGETIHGRNVVVQRYRRGEIPRSCHILFLSKSEPRNAQILRDRKNLGTLTFGDAEQFGRHGGVIRFFLDRNNPRLEINDDARQCERLVIDAKLLSLPIVKVVHLGCGSEGG